MGPAAPPLLITLYYTGVAGWIRRCHGSRLLPGSFRQTRAFVLTLLLAPFSAWRSSVRAPPS